MECNACSVQFWSIDFFSKEQLLISVVFPQGFHFKFLIQNFDLDQKQQNLALPNVALIAQAPSVFESCSLVKLKPGMRYICYHDFNPTSTCFHQGPTALKITISAPIWDSIWCDVWEEFKTTAILNVEHYFKRQVSRPLYLTGPYRLLFFGDIASHSTCNRGLYARTAFAAPINWFMDFMCNIRDE